MEDSKKTGAFIYTLQTILNACPVLLLLGYFHLGLQKMLY